jgi:hypothetical protein
VGRTLGRDVKDRETFDFIAEEVETDWFVVLSRPDVDDAATHRDLGAVFDELLAPVPHIDETFYEAVAFNLAAATQHNGVRERLGRQDLGD